MLGKTISHYRIIDSLGQGGMGVVYKAEDTKLKRVIALKFLPPQISSDPGAKQRFIHEAQAASALDHPNICTIYEISETDDGQSYIAMACYEGQSLKLSIDNGQLTIDNSIDITLQIAKGLQKAHAHGIIHRDIKPANIMITADGTAKILDFGLAKLAGQTRLTKTGSTVGTAAYMSPEQARGDVVDQRTDIWSLGVVLYEMLTGQLPFKGDYEQALIYSILNEEPLPVSVLNEDISVELEQIVNKCLAKDPAARFQYVEEMLHAFKPLHTEAGILWPESFSQFVTRMYRRKKVRYVTLSSAVLIIIAALIILFKPFFFKDLLYAGPQPIAVISFKNETRDNLYNVWEKALPDLLITKLEQSGGLRVTPWERLQDLKKKLGKEDIDFIDLDLGIQLCQAEGVEMVVSGSLFKAGETFAVDIKVFDVDTKTILKSANARGDGEASILNSQIDRLSEEISRGLGLSENMLEALQKPVRDVTTRSVEAYKFYIQGMVLMGEFRNLEAKAFLEQAVSLDSSFASAYFILGRIYSTLHLNKKSEEAVNIAMKNLEHVPEREKLRWQFWFYIDKDTIKADSLLQAYEKKFGADYRSHSRRASLYDRKKEYDKAIREYQLALQLGPGNSDYDIKLGYCYLYSGQYEQALKYFRKYAARSPDDANVHDCLGDVYRSIGDVDAMIAEYREVYRIDANNPWATNKLALSYAWKENYDEAINWSLQYNIQYRPDLPLYDKGVYEYLSGRFRQAVIDLDRSIQTADSIYHCGEKPGTLGNAQYLKAWIYYELGKYKKGRDELHSLEKYSGYDAYLWLDKITNYKYEAMSFLKIGQLDSVKKYQEILETMFLDTAYTNSQRDVIKIYHDLIKAEILLTDDSVKAALELSNQIKLDEFTLFTRDRIHLTLLPFQFDLAARAFLKLNQLDQAISEYERLTSGNPHIRGWHLVPAKYHHILARLYEKKSWPGKAMDKYHHFLEVWKEADQDIPEIIDAKKRLAALQGKKIQS